MALPHLWLTAPVIESRRKRSGGPSAYRTPSKERQQERLAPAFQTLQTMMTDKRAAWADRGDGITPEKVLVIETVGSVEKFFNALANTELEWLYEVVVDDQQPDDDFFNKRDPTKSLGGRLYLSIANQAALDQLVRLWERWLNDERMDRGLAPFRPLFEQTRTIRYWNSNDRLVPEVIEDWQIRLTSGEEVIPFEVELVFGRASNQRDAKTEVIRDLAERAGGQLVRECQIEGINYHGVLLNLPEHQIREFLNNTDAVALAQADEILYFRPVGQATITLSQEGLEETLLDEAVPTEDPSPPIGALLDGLPATHPWIAPFLKIDDPDDWAQVYPPNHRRHGTAMASMILHGDFQEDGKGPTRKLYCRPILQPAVRAMGDPPPEVIPDNELMVDIIHRAVTRLFEPRNDEPAVAPQILVINLSIGDPHRPYYREISPCARLLDWLAWRYQVLFIVSCGNAQQDIVLHVSRNEFRSMEDAQKQDLVLKAIYRDRGNRRVLSPAESVNGLTIGALHADLTTQRPPAGVVDPVGERKLQVASQTVGAGVNRSIKPELTLEGGRLFYDLRLDGDGSETVLRPQYGLFPPGQKVAQPIGPDRAGFGYTSGSSNAAANATRSAISIYDKVIKPLTSENPVSRALEVCLMKALLVHGASWGSDASKIEELLIAEGIEKKVIRDPMCAFLGYGSTDIERVLTSTEQRVTVLATNSLMEEQGHYYELPLPPALSGRAIERRITVTLAWLSPCDGKLQKYRKAGLWAYFPPHKVNALKVKRREGHHQTVLRGTVQHEILSREIVVDYGPEAVFPISVHCKADFGSLDVEVPYALCVTLETAADVGINIYEQIRERIAAQAAIVTPA